MKLVEKFSGKMPSLGAMLDLRKAYAEGQRDREAQSAVQQAVPTTVVLPAMRVAAPEPGARPAPSPAPTRPAASVVPTDPASMAHFLAVKNSLMRDEQVLVVALAQELTEQDRATWFNELRGLSVPDAVATVRATLAQLDKHRQPTPSLTTPPAVVATNQGPPTPTAVTGEPTTTQGMQGQSGAS